MTAVKAAATCAAAALLLTSCFAPLEPLPGEDEPTAEDTKAFTFHLKGDFATSYTDMGSSDTKGTTDTSNTGSDTRAASRLEDGNAAGITDVWVLDYVTTGEGSEAVTTLMQSVHQTSTDEGITFGSVPMALSYGHHEIKFVASKGSGAMLKDAQSNAIPNGYKYEGGTAITTATLSWQKAHDTFTLSYPIDVTASSNGNRAPELKRAISGLKVVITDAIPQDAKYITLTLGSRSQSLTLPGLSPLPYSESSVTLDCTANRGLTGKAAAIYSLAADEDWTSTAHIAVTREDGTVITSFALPDVTLRRNRMTTLTGEVFNRTSGFQLSIDTAWDEDLTDTF